MIRRKVFGVIEKWKAISNALSAATVTAVIFPTSHLVRDCDH
jgi:hypothetical protein